MQHSSWLDVVGSRYLFPSRPCSSLLSHSSQVSIRLQRNAVISDLFEYTRAKNALDPSWKVDVDDGIVDIDDLVDIWSGILTGGYSLTNALVLVLPLRHLLQQWLLVQRRLDSFYCCNIFDELLLSDADWYGYFIQSAAWTAHLSVSSAMKCLWSSVLCSC